MTSVLAPQHFASPLRPPSGVLDRSLARSLNVQATAHIWLLLLAAARRDLVHVRVRRQHALRHGGR
eukprot:6572845-Prymnesium_polylepis.1